VKIRIKLRITGPGCRPRKVAFELEENQKFYLGSATPTLPFAHESVLPEHCFLWLRAGGLTVSDISGGRTSVNGEKIISHVAQPGDSMEMGAFQVEFLEVPVPPTPGEQTRPLENPEAPLPTTGTGQQYEYELRTAPGFEPRLPSAEPEPELAPPADLSLPPLESALTESRPASSPGGAPSEPALRDQMLATAQASPHIELEGVPRRSPRGSAPGGSSHGGSSRRGSSRRRAKSAWAGVRRFGAWLSLTLQFALLAAVLLGGYWLLRSYARRQNWSQALSDVRLRARHAVFGRIEWPKELLPAPARVPAGQGTDAFLSVQLLEAARRGNLVAMRNLVNEARVPVDYPSPEGLTPLMAAAEAGQLEMAKLLVATGANVNAADAHGTTALMWAAFRNRRAVAAFLVERGANPAQARRGGETAQTIARRWGYGELASYLANPRAFPGFGAAAPEAKPVPAPAPASAARSPLSRRNVRHPAASARPAQRLPQFSGGTVRRRRGPREQVLDLTHGR
jgi:hypothetical protein